MADEQAGYTGVIYSEHPPAPPTGTRVTEIVFEESEVEPIVASPPGYGGVIAFEQVEGTLTPVIPSPMEAPGGTGVSGSGSIELGQLPIVDDPPSYEGVLLDESKVEPTTSSSLNQEYTGRWVIGPVTLSVSAEKAMTIMQDHPNLVFPFIVQGQQGETAIIAGRKYDLIGTIHPLLGPHPVEVLETTPTSFTFRALEGHFDPPGSTITFRTFEEGGNVILEQHGRWEAARDRFFGRALDMAKESGAYWAWKNQAANLRAQVYGGGYDYVIAE